MKIKMNDATAKYSREEKMEWLKEKMRLNAQQLVSQPDNLYYIDVNIYHPKGPNRLCVNIDFIFAAGSKPFKVTANCMGRDRKRELTRNVKYPEWEGYLTALSALSSAPQGQIYAGKLKNRVSKYYPLSRFIIPKTVVIVNKGIKHHEVLLIIGDSEYLIDCSSLENTGTSKQVQYFSHHGSWQTEEEQELDIDV